MKALLTLAIVAFSQITLASGVSPLAVKTAVCSNAVGTITVTNLSSVTLDIAAIPVVQPNPIRSVFAVTANPAYSTSGIQCGFQGSARRGHHIAPCQENEFLTGMDHGSLIQLSLKRDINPAGQPTSGYYIQVLGAVQQRGDLGESITGAAMYNRTFTCELN